MKEPRTKDYVPNDLDEVSSSTHFSSIGLVTVVVIVAVADAAAVVGAVGAADIVSGRPEVVVAVKEASVSGVMSAKGD